MARSLKQIQQELDNIQETTSELSQELQEVYARYIELLGQSAKKQLILAAYQLCTQIYPEVFLKLPFNQREKLQQGLQELGGHIISKLQEKVTPEELTPDTTDLSMIAEMLKNLPLDRMRDRSSKTEKSQVKPPQPSEPNQNQVTEEIESELELEIATDEVQLPLPEDFDSATAIIMQGEEEIVIEGVQEISLEALQELASNEPEKSDPIEELDFSNPEHLVLWQKTLEKKFRKTLATASRQANSGLQKTGVIPASLPAKLLDVAIKTGGNGSNSKLRNLPNIINLTIENDSRKKLKNKLPTQVSLLRLKLSELEFSDPQLSGQRNSIRSLSKKVKQIADAYQTKKHEQAQAEADAAWRSSWYEK